MKQKPKINILNTVEDKNLFVETILNPPAPNNKLKNSQINHEKLVETNKIKIVK